MKKGFERFHRIVERLVNGSGVVGAFLLLVVAGMTFYEVIMRYIFSAPTTWSIDLSIYLIMWGTFLGAAYTLKQGGHIYVDVIVNKFPERKRTLLRIFIHILILLFCGILTWRGVASCIDAYRLGEITLSYTRMPLYLPMLSIPMGGGLLTLEVLRELTEMARSRKD